MTRHPAGVKLAADCQGALLRDTTHWLGFSPLQIKSVTFANGSTANKWAVVSDFGGTAEVNQYCPSYGGPYCTYPWYAFNGTSSAFTYGVGGAAA